jgi:TolB-like protein
MRFGNFTLDLDRRKLTCAGTQVRLGGRALDILCVLAAAKGSVVAKDELMAQIWPGQVIEENAIQAQISALRKVLDQGRDGESYVGTVQGRGYRLLELQPRPDERDIDRSKPAAVAGASIAVLPFLNIGSDPEQDYFADGVVEDITTGLSRIRWLFVIARNSSFAYKGKAADVNQVGRELGVRYVLEGSVRKAGNRVRITAQLIEAETGTHLWAERYDRLLDDIFALQDEITMAVIGAIEPSLRKAEVERVKRKRPDSLDAYDLVLRALPFTYNHIYEDAAKAIPLLEKAIALEPGYAAAHAPLAWCYHFLYSRAGLRAEDRAAAIHHAHAAIEGGGDDPTALGIAGLVISLDEHDHATALNVFDNALALSNSNIFALSCSALILSWLGQTDLAIERAQRALRLSPFDSLNYLSYNALAISYFCTQRNEEALDAARRSVQINPRFSVCHLFLTAALVGVGRVDEAKLHAQKALALNPIFTIRQYAVTAGIEPIVFARLTEAWLAAGLPEE